MAGGLTSTSSCIFYDNHQICWYLVMFHDLSYGDFYWHKPCHLSHVMTNKFNFIMKWVWNQMKSGENSQGFLWQSGLMSERIDRTSSFNISAPLYQLGITSGFPDYGFPAYFCHFKHVFHRKLLLSQIAARKLKIRLDQFLEHFLAHLCIFFPWKIKEKWL